MAQTGPAQTETYYGEEDPNRDEHSSEEHNSDEPPQQSQVFGQKRRRVTRACDECRRKKIKCDGKQPCTHCTMYTYECTYDQPSHRRRNLGAQYVESLERRLHRAEAVLHSIAPHIDLDDPSLDSSISDPPSATASIPAISVTPSDAESSGPSHTSKDAMPENGELESMIRATGQLDLDEKGHWEYYGISSGLNFLRRVRDQFGNVLDPNDANSRSHTVARSRHIGQDFSSPRSPGRIIDSPLETVQAGRGGLPSREDAHRLCSDALDDASAILNFVHKPSFYYSLDRIYRIPPTDFETQDEKFLPLLYSVMALGCLFDKCEDSALEQGGYPSATTNGYKYMKMARSLIDLTDCRDLTSLQTIIFMIMFLQCSAKLATCYLYIGIALRSALRMGLHRAFRDSFSPIEAETRARVFWVIRKMDIYVGAMLGLPLTLGPDDFDQILPTEVDDEYITEKALLKGPEGVVPLAAASNANFKLCKILAKIVKSVYPIKGAQNPEQNPSRAYSVSFSTIYELEKDLKDWEEALPSALKPGGVQLPAHIGPMQQLLRLAYAHAQMMLYRPFLHYVSPRTKPATVDQRAYGCAAACISVSRNVIHIVSTMKDEGLLVGSYWFTMYTAFFAVLSLLYFVAENPKNPTSKDLMRDAREGREALAQLSKRSMAADRCTTTLNTVFKSLETTLQAMEDASSRSSSSRKRMASSTKASRSLSHDDITNSHSATSEKPQLTRAGTSQRPQGPQKKSTQAAARASTQKMPNVPTASVGSTNGSTDSQESSTSSFSHESNSHPRTRMAHTPRSQVQPSSFQNLDQHPNMYQQTEQYSQQVREHQQQQQQRSFLQQSLNYARLPLDGQNLEDFTNVSAIMFPSADPFQYPNQPMTTLDEQCHAYHRGMREQHNLSDYIHTNEGSMYTAHDGRDTTMSGQREEHIDAQLYGPLPLYFSQPGQIMAGYPPVQLRSQNMDDLPSGQVAPSDQHQMWPEQIKGHGLDNFNYDDVFGNEEEWRESFM